MKDTYLRSQEWLDNQLTPEQIEREAALVHKVQVAYQAQIKTEWKENPFQENV